MYLKKAIPDHRDYTILNDCVNRILGSDISKDIDRMFSYDYETEGQFANIVRAHGYKLEKTADSYRLFKGGANAGSIADSDILSHRTDKSRKRKDRATQLKVIIKKYRDVIAQEKSPSLSRRSQRDVKESLYLKGQRRHQKDTRQRGQAAEFRESGEDSATYRQTEDPVWN